MITIDAMGTQTEIVRLSGMVWNASPLQRFGETKGVFTEELQAEVERRGMKDILFLSLPEVPEAGSFSERLAEIKKVITKKPQQQLANV